MFERYTERARRVISSRSMRRASLVLTTSSRSTSRSLCSARTRLCAPTLSEDKSLVRTSGAVLKHELHHAGLIPHPQSPSVPL
jgi:hypothetical protein